MARRAVVLHTAVSGAPRYFAEVNGLSMFIFGLVLYYASSSVVLFAVAILGCLMFLSSVMVEATAKGWYRESANMFGYGAAALIGGYFAAPYLYPAVRLFADVFAGFGKYLVSLIDPSRALLLFPVVAIVIPLVVEGIAAFVRGVYLSLTLQMLGYPVLVFAVSFLFSIGLVAFVTYVYSAFIVYVISCVLAASTLLLIRLLESLAVFAGLAFLAGFSYLATRFVPELVGGVADSMVGLAMYEPELGFRDSVRRFYILNFLNYVLYAVLGYSYFVEARDWLNVATAAITLIATSELSLMSFYMLRQYPSVSPRLARRVVHMASGLEAMAMAVMALSSIAVSIAFVGASDMYRRLIPFYEDVIREVFRFIFSVP